MNLSPLPIQKFFDNNGEPLVGGLLFTYESGTSVKAATYTDESGLSVNTNPIVLDYRGEARVWLDPIKSYKFVLSPRGDTDPPTKPIWTVDNVTAPLSYLDLTRQIIGRIFYPRSQEEISAGITPVNYYEYYGNVLRYATNTNPGVTDMSGALAAANTVALASGLPVTITDVVHIASATSVSAPIADTLYQIFTTTSQVTLSGCPFIRPEWWGMGQGNIRIAINALPSTGGVVQLEDKTYPIQGFSYGTGVTAGVCISKDNVRIQGRMMPRFANDMRSLTGGTIIQGFFLVFANNFQISDVGIDSGITVVNTYYGGTPVDALLCTYPDDTTKAASALRTFVRHHNVVGLCASPSALVHAIIAGEGYDQVICTGDMMAGYGIHGVVFKCTSVRAASIAAFCNAGEGVIIKSDVQSTAQAGQIQIDKIYSRAQGPNGLTPYITAAQSYGILIQPAANAVDIIEIGQVISYGATIGIANLFGGGYASSSIKIGRAVIDQLGVSGTCQGLQLTGTSPQIIVRWNIEHLEVRNSTIAAQFVFDNITGNQHCHIGHLHAANCGTGVDIGSKSYVSLGTVTTDTLANGVYHITGTPRLTVGMLFQDTNTTTTYDPSSGGLVPALSNAWTQVPGNDPFGVDLVGGRVNLRGLVKPGASTTLTTLPRWAWPLTNKRTIAQGLNAAATAQALVPILIDSSGNVSVNEVGGGTTNCAGWLSLSGITFDAQA